MTTTALAEAATQLALMPDFLDPIKLIGYFGTWALVGLLVVIFVESGVLFPVLPGDTLLFVASMLAAGTAAAGQADFQLWQLLVFIPIALALEWLHAGEVWIFFAAALAVVPLAGLIGYATEQLSLRSGPGIGGHARSQPHHLAAAGYSNRRSRHHRHYPIAHPQLR